MSQVVQRTLIVTGGPVAEQAGRHFLAMLTNRGGPAAALGLVAVALADPPAEPGLALETALQQISRIDLPGRLHEQGYLLDGAAEIALILLLDAEQTSRSEADRLAQAINALVARQVGLETVALLIWLAADPAHETVTDCLGGDGFLFPRGILALGRRNEAGLLLADEASLARQAAELLWALVATPLHALPEWLTWIPALPGEANLATAGIACWQWSPDALRQRMSGRWLRAVLSAWLSAPAARIEAGVGVGREWLEAHQLSPAGLQGQLFGPAVPASDLADPGDYRGWQAPWPWQIPALLAALLATEGVDEEAQDQDEARSEDRLGNILAVAYGAMQATARAILDGRPTGSVQQAQAWAAALGRELDEMHQTMRERAAEREAGDALLAAERGEITAELSLLLGKWPPATTPISRSWLNVAFCPWQWPSLAWRYFQLRGLGRRLAQICQRQVARRRQQVMAEAAIQGYQELAGLARQVESQVDEVGQMLAYLRQQIEKELPVEPEPDWPERVLAQLYQELTGEVEVETAVAAEAIGGLGQQLAALDEEIVATLRPVAISRLAGVDRLTAADLLNRLYPTAEAWAAWWQLFWEEATPLWRYDPAQLPERSRARETMRAGVCGAGATALRVRLPEPVHVLESADRERILLVRLRGGLNQAAMARPAEPVTERPMMAEAEPALLNEGE